MSGAPSPNRPRPWRASAGLMAAAGLVVAATSCFWLSDGSFITGEETVLRLPLLSYWRNLPVVFSAFFTSFTDAHYRPLSYALLAVLRTFVPLDRTWFWQLVPLAFQTLNVVLVFALLRGLAGRVWPAAAGAAVFALHPLGSVVEHHVVHLHYVAGLSCCLASALCWGAHLGRPRPGYWLASVVLYGLGLATTKAAIVLPVMLLAHAATQRRPWRRVVLGLAPLAALAVAAIVVWRSVGPPAAFYKSPDLPAGTWRRSLISVVGGSSYYVQGLLLGMHLPIALDEVVERRNEMLALVFLWPTSLYALLCAASLGALWRARAWSASRSGVSTGAGGVAALGVLWGLVTFAPFLSTGWNPVDDYVAWPYLYFPLVGLAGIVAAGLRAASRRGLAVRVAAALAVAAGCSGYGVGLVRLNLAAGSAERYWQGVIEANPKSGVASAELGRLRLAQGLVRQALPLLYNANVTGTKRSSMAMAEHYLKRHEPLAAAIHCQGASVPTTGLTSQTVKPITARLFRQVGALDFAEAIWGETLLANPYNTDAMRRLAEVWHIKGFVRAARRMVRRAIAVDPWDPRLRTAFAGLHEHPARARTVALAPVPMLGYLLTARNHPDVESQVLKLGDQFEDDPAIQLAAGMVLVRENHCHLALRKLERAERFTPSSGVLHATKCFAYSRIGAYAEATREADRALELANFDANTCCIVGTAMMGLGRAERAVECLRKAVDINPSYATGHTNLGMVLRTLGRLDEAIAHLRQAVKITPGSAIARADLGGALLLKGQTAEGIESLRSALEFDPALAEAHAQLGAALVAQGLSEEGAKHIQAAIRLSPGVLHSLPPLPGSISPEKLKSWSIGSGL